VMTIKTTVKKYLETSILTAIVWFGSHY
jgi:hypothetical protein